MSGQVNEQSQRLLKPSEVAKRLRVHVAVIYRWILSGRLPAMRPGPRLYLVREDDVDGLLRPVMPAPKLSLREKNAMAKRQAAWVDEVLKQHGLA